MAEPSRGKRVAILATNGFEQSELEEPKKALQQAGATAEVVSPVSGQIRGWNHTDWGKAVPVDVELERADPSRYDALVLPGGVMNPDALRTLKPPSISCALSSARTSPSRPFATGRGPSSTRRACAGAK